MEETAQDKSDHKVKINVLSLLSGNYFTMLEQPLFAKGQIL